MNFIQKKLTGLLLLLTVCIPLVFTLILLGKQHIIQYQMKERLEKQFLQTIIIPSEKVNWVKYQKEILVHGKMFDIKTYSKTDDAYTFTGLYDEEETAVLSHLNKSTQKNNEAQNQLLTRVLQWLASACPNELPELSSLQYKGIPEFDFIKASISSPFKTILTPPPQI